MIFRISRISNAPPIVGALALLLLAAMPHLAAGTLRPILILPIAAAIGATFVARSISFTAAFRDLIETGDGTRLAGLLPIAAVAATAIVPICALDPDYTLFQAPIGLPLIGGAALFGIGMQLANGCGSGTLCSAGDGSRRMWIALPCFCLGGVLGSLILPAALDLPSLPSFSLGEHLGPVAGLLATWAAILALGTLLLRGRRPPDPRPALLVGLLAAALFLVARQPWGITWGLTLWGARSLSAVGIDFTAARFWRWDGPAADLAATPFFAVPSLMDIGLLCGAILASALPGRSRHHPWPSLRGLIGAAIGGIVMGIGARLSSGCNIGAMIGGMASGSLHGFVWCFAVLPGCWLGVRLRPLVGLSTRAAP